MKPAPGFLQTLPHADLALCPFSVISLSWESPQESTKLGVHPGTPGTEVNSQLLSSYLNCNLFTQFIFKI